MGTISNFTLPFGLADDLNLTEFDFNNKVFGPFNYIAVFNVFVLFGALWSMSFTSGIAHMTMAHVVAKWYWSGSPDDYRTAGEMGAVLEREDGVYEAFGQRSLWFSVDLADPAGEVYRRVYPAQVQQGEDEEQSGEVPLYEPQLLPQVCGNMCEVYLQARLCDDGHVWDVVLYFHQDGVLGR